MKNDTNQASITGQISLQNRHILTSSDELLSVVCYWRAQRLIVGFTCGAFDLLHAGHADYLEKASSLCDRLVVGVNSDDSIKTYKNPLRPVIKQEHRLQLVAALRSVSAAILMYETRPASLIELFQPDVYIKGGDYRKDQLKSAPLVESYGGRCEVIPVVHEISTSVIIDRVQDLLRYAQPDFSGRSSGPVIFLDRDGTLIQNVHFLNDPRRVVLLRGVGEGLRSLQDNGFQLVMVTNQQGIGLGYFDYDTFVAINSELFRQLAPFGVKISKVYFCPHSFAEECECRKPRSQLIKKGLADFAVKADQCFMIGDSEIDMAAADDAGCQGILVTSKKDGSRHRAVEDFPQAVNLVLRLKNQDGKPSR